MNKLLIFILICLSCLGKELFDKKIIELSSNYIWDYKELEDCNIDELEYIFKNNKSLNINEFYYYVFNENPNDLYVNYFKKLPNNKKIDFLFYLYEKNLILSEEYNDFIDINGVNSEGKTLIELIIEDNRNSEYRSYIAFTVQDFLDKGLKVEGKSRLKLIEKLFDSKETENLFEVLDRLKFNSKDVKDIEKMGVSLLIEKVKNSYGNDKIEILKYLLDKGSDINYRDKEGYTALFYSSDEDTIKFLLENGANLKIKYKVDSSKTTQEREIFYSNPDFFTVINILNNLTKEQEESVDYLKLYKYIDEEIPKNLSVEDETDFKSYLGNKVLSKDKKVIYSLLALAAKKNDAELFEKVFEEGIKFTPKELNELLDISGEYKSSYVVAILIKNGGNLEKFNKKYSNFYFDIWKEDYYSENVEDIFKTLIKAGVDFKDDKEEYYGDDLLSYAVRRKNLKIIELLLDNGMDPNIKIKEGETPIILALKYYDDEYMKIADKLLEKGANILGETYNGKSFLSLIVENSLYEYKCKRILELLEIHNINIGIKDSDGDGLLHYLSSMGYVNLLKKYVDKGFNPNDKNNENLRAIDYFYGKETYDYLIKVTKDVDLKKEEGRELLKNSIVKSDYEMFNYFLEKGVKIEAGDLDYLLSRVDTEDEGYFYNKYIIKKLLEKAEKIEYQDSLVNLAIKNNDIETLDNLSERGIDAYYFY